MVFYTSQQQQQRQHHDHITVMNLPPRYIMDETGSPYHYSTVMLKSNSSQSSSSSNSNGKSVWFNDSALETHHAYEKAPKELHSKLWYRPNDMYEFQMEYLDSRANTCQEIKDNNDANNYALVLNDFWKTDTAIRRMELQITTQTFVPGAGRQRKPKIQSILDHQQAYRLEGLSDPEGLSLLSRALCKDDKKKAWQSANLNAIEVDEMNREEEIGLDQVLIDYFVNEVFSHASGCAPLLALSEFFSAE